MMMLNIKKNQNIAEKTKIDNDDDDQESINPMMIIIILELFWLLFFDQSNKTKPKIK